MLNDNFFAGKMKTAADILILVLVLFQTGCTRTGEADHITIAVARQPISAPVYIAQEKKFFEREGLQVNLRPYWTGKEALESVTGKYADFSTVAETPVVFASFKNEQVVLIATIADSDKYVKIVARSDRKIAEGRDLKGKNIGVSPGTNAEYFLDAYLTFNGILRDEIHRVSVKPEMMADALVKGDIDAAVSWEPHAANQQKKLGKNAIVLMNEQIYQISWNIAAHREYVKNHPETVQKVLRGLMQAQKYITEHPQEARTVISRNLGDGQFNLDDFNFDLRLAQTLVLDLEEQARWAIKSGLTDKKETPNFLNVLYFSGMETVAPESVTVLHK